MDSLISYFAMALMAIAVAPLLVLGLYLLADALGLKGAERVLSASVGLLTLQWLAGSVMNIGGGLALAALGGWLAWRWGPLPVRAAGALLVPFGLWRVGRGVAILQAALKRPRAQPHPAAGSTTPHGDST